MEVFLLGGCDLEMCAIKRLLKKYNKKFYDKNLKWGAKLSDYTEELQKHKNDTIYAIELTKDIEAKVIEIDHHNENSKKPSSIAQVANILNHKLSRFEEAVAINDSQYIPGLMCEFHNEDIKRIRRLDRKCQGVTELEEKEAKNIELKPIMEFNFEHFSPLCDRIHFEKGWKEYIIFNDKLTMFYGFEIKKLKNYLEKNDIKPSFWGGGENGFLGVEKKLDEEFLQKVYDNNIKDIKSTHIFMFPFVIKKDKKDNFKQTITKEFKQKEFLLDKVENYNEYIYFYPHVRDVLFRENDSALYYEKELKKDKKHQYIINLKKGGVYTLDIENISLRIFNDSIGILSFHLNNYKYTNADDILKINEFGRRIFPQYLDSKCFVDAPKDSFLADSIEIIINDECFAKDDFSKFNKLDELSIENLESVLIPEFIQKFIGNDVKTIIDDRMFVISFYLDDTGIVCNLTKFDDEKNEYSFSNNDWWYKYVFVDGDLKTCQSKIMCKEVIKKSTYDRWIGEETLWGVSRYSFVSISKKSWFSENILLIHSKTMYYQIMTLLLMYRAMIVYFSDEVQDIVEKIRNKDIKQVEQDSKKLYEEYLKFLNGLYFREVTPQDQGIEIYKKALEIMEIENQIKDFDREISELDNYIALEVEKNRNKELDKLNKIATLFLPPTFIASFLGMNVGNFDTYKELKFIGAVILMFMSMIVSEWIFLPEDDKKISKWLEEMIPSLKGIEKYKWWIFGIIVISLILFGVVGK